MTVNGNTSTDNAQLPPGSILCGKCWKPIEESAVYCPFCGTHQDFQKKQAALEKAREQWNTLKSIIIFYTVYLGSILPLFHLDDKNKALGIMVISVVDIFIILTFWYHSKLPLTPLFRLEKKTLKQLAVALAIAVGLLLVNLGYHSVIISLLKIKLHLLTDPFRTAGIGFGMVILFGCAMPAIWEEIAFRGLILTALAKRFSRWEAILISAGLFAVIHTALLSWPYLFLFGIIAGYMRVKYKSLWPVILLHFLHNLAVFLFEYVYLS